MEKKFTLPLCFPVSPCFQAMQQCQLQGISHFEDEDGKFYGLDYRVWHSLRISAHTRVNIPPQMAFGLAPGHEVGLTDVTVWHAMVSICRSSSSPYDEPPLMITPFYGRCAAHRDFHSFSNAMGFVHSSRRAMA